MTTRLEFLTGVREAMARAGARPPAAPVARPADPAAAADAVRARARTEGDGLLARFRAEAERVGTVVSRVATVDAAAEAVVALSRTRGARRAGAWSPEALGPVAGVAARLRAAGLPVVAAPDGAPDAAGRATLREAWAGADLGLTTADLAVAATGSLALVSGPGRARGVSLLPTCHVAVLGRSRLVATLEDATLFLEAWLGTPVGANIVFVTGPSRTADIELTLTRGVHGPKEVHAVVVDEL